jgi:hypothetical protein
MIPGRRRVVQADCSQRRQGQGSHSFCKRPKRHTWRLNSPSSLQASYILFSYFSPKLFLTSIRFNQLSQLSRFRLAFSHQLSAKNLIFTMSCRSKLCLRFKGSYLLQRMTAQRNDLMTPKASDPHRLTPCALCLAPLFNPQSPLLPLLGLD